MVCDVTWNPGERNSPRKGNATGPDTEKRIFQEMSQAFQFLLCNPLDARAADTFWTELAGTPGVSDSSPGGFSLREVNRLPETNGRADQKYESLFCNSSPGHSLNASAASHPPPPQQH